MPDSKRDFVFLLRFNISDLKEINTKLDTDCDHWAGAKCTFTPVTGEYDMVVHAAGGTLQEALNYAAYLTKTGRWKTTTLMAFSLGEFWAAADPELPVPNRR